MQQWAGGPFSTSIRILEKNKFVFGGDEFEKGMILLRINSEDYRKV
jgi:hypothetical protein